MSSAFSPDFHSGYTAFYTAGNYPQAVIHIAHSGIWRKFRDFDKKKCGILTKVPKRFLPLDNAGAAQ
ncbi:hypothetical protein [Agathobaculum sp.]|uniref:hypothetical protein n=1 Tax=Agathobaculum sp. TaxID=2048138 RepID=UPI003D8F3E4C